MFSVASLIAGNCNIKTAVQALWFYTMKILLNLTHDNGNLFQCAFTSQYLIARIVADPLLW